jgi:hypothetical protein
MVNDIYAGAAHGKNYFYIDVLSLNKIVNTLK